MTQRSNDTLTLRKNLTHSLATAGDAERLLFAALSLNDRDQQLAEIRLFLKPDQFASKIWGEAYKAFCELSDARKPTAVEYVAPIVANACGMPLKDIELAFVDALENAPVSWHDKVSEYARSVVRQWQQVESRRLALRFVTSLQAASSSVEDAIDEMSKELGRVRDGYAPPSTEEFNLRAALDDFIDQPEVEAIPTGLPILDRGLRGGFRAQQLIVIGARASVGKSALSGQMAVSMAMLNHPTLFLANEMTQTEMIARWLKQTQLIPSDEVDRDLFGSMPLQMKECHGWSIDRLELVAQRAADKDGLKVLVLDQLGPLAGSNPRMSTLERITDNTGRLKSLAGKLNIVVIVAHQFNRAKEGRDTSRPRMSDFRDSGSVEQDADILLGLHRDLTPGHDGKANLFVMKNRSGELSDIALDFDGDRTLFKEPGLPSFH